MSVESAPWEPVAKPRAHELVIQAIEDRIVAGTLGVGDALPPERELAARLEVSRAGVREAVRVLEAQGVLRSRVGSGAEAGTFIAALPDAALTRFLRLHVALANFPVTDVVETRIGLERTAAALAAGSAGTAELDAIVALVRDMNDPALARDAYNDADAQLHIAIAHASGNRLLGSMAVAIRAALRDPLIGVIRDAADWDGIRAELQRQHTGIADALRARDAAGAAAAVEEHIRYSARVLPLP